MEVQLKFDYTKFKFNTPFALNTENNLKMTWQCQTCCCLPNNLTSVYFVDGK
jgi:hypothetical protein